MKKLNLSKTSRTNFLTYGMVIVLYVVLQVMANGGMLSSSLKGQLVPICAYVVMALSLNLTVGVLGELSLGHAGFMSVGAFSGAVAAASMAESIPSGPIRLALAMIIGAAIAGVAGVLIGIPVLRLKGDYLAITTLAFGEIVRTIFMNTSPESFGGALGLATPRFNKKFFFIICLVMVLVTLAVVQNLIRSKHGRAITAIRDNEIAARSTGINVTQYKLTGFIVAAIFAGIAGVLFSYTQSNVSSATFDYNYSIEILVMVVLGGMGSINGSIIAATLITYLNKELTTVLTGDLAVLKDLVYALILILIVIYNNSPRLAGVREKYNLKNLFKRVTKNRFAEGDDTGRWDVVPTKIKMDALLSTDFVVNEIKPDKPNDAGEEKDHE